MLFYVNHTNGVRVQIKNVKMFTCHHNPLVPNMCSNIPASPAYGVYISQLIRYARASSNYTDFLKRHLYLRNRLLDQGYKKICLIRSLKSLYSNTKILSKYIPSLQRQ